jgi:hypothetical protein
MVLTRVTLHVKIGQRKVKTYWFGTIFARLLRLVKRHSKASHPVEKSGEAHNKG